MPTPFVILAALSLLASAPVSATPIAEKLQRIKEVPTCEGKEQDSKFTFSTPSGVYDIICGNDYFGGDLKSSTADTFEACLLDCDKTDGCISVSYQGSACYMKNETKTAVAAPLVTTAKKQGTSTSPSAPPKVSSLTCENKASDNSIYEAANGKFKILCGKDYAGGDLKTVNVARFEDCIKACDTTGECIDVSYVNGACYLKRSTATLVTADWVWTAVLQNPQINAISCVDNVSNGATYTAKTGGSYKIECGLDYAGGDMQSLDTATIELCMDACDLTDGCVDVSFVYGTCYLKNVVNGNGTPVGHVWTGRQVTKTTTAAAPRMTLGVNTDFETSNLNDWLQDQFYRNPMSANIVNGGDNSPRSLQLSHNGGDYSSVYLWQGIPASAANKWFRVEFSTMYTHDNGQNWNTCFQAFTWAGQFQGVIFATTGLLPGTSQNSMPNTRCSSTFSSDNIPRPRPGVWARHTAWFQATDLNGLYDLQLTARCDAGAPAQQLYFDNIRVVEEDC
ncbi:hypothetical protein HBI24_004880 [Parastagonospora nodorum]|nr:hypothetical protein HBI52_107780 [Parastagonospora nodorum]KAH5595107.1 hypothetical protein HBI24_004880 [Parastagonospora nodorum]